MEAFLCPNHLLVADSQDMRQRYDAEGPAEHTRAGGNMDRSQGAARAITVSASRK